ncbi:MAG: hypothetical protein ACM3ZE_19375, partial [Myxococcales bacterium]
MSLLCARHAAAERVPSLIAGANPVEVPKELVPWVPWVSQGITEGLCLKMAEEELCEWPAAVSIEVGEGGADFTFETFLETEGWVKLPGSAAHWPESVDADHKSVAVLSKEGAPVMRLARGAHRIHGRFVWSKAPETLIVPASVGVVRLSVAGRAVEFPRREDSGAVWLLAGTGGESDASERSEIEVFRRIDDGVPLRVTTHLLLHLSGRTRELRLLGAALPGSRPLSIESPIPARLEDNGELVLHATAGEHRIILNSIYPQPPEKLELPTQSPNWPKTEAWVFVANNALRQVELTGAPGIDTSQTNLPDDWKQHQAFLLSSGKSLAFETKRRGEPEPAPNQVNLTRQLLLDLDGKGFTVQDQIHAELSRAFRLDLASPNLGRVAAKGKDLLITRSPSDALGVELREQKNDLVAEWRINQAQFNVPAVGWQSDVNSLSTTLHLGPGWEAIHVSGADSVDNTWWDEWSLWSFFYVLLITIAITKLFGLPAGALALGTLVVTHGRADALMVFWGLLLVLLTLLRLVPESWFRRLLRAVWLTTVLVFAALIVDFAITEVRGAFFPITQAPRLDAFGAVGGEDVAVTASELKQAPPVPVPVEPAAPAQAQTDELEASPAKPAQEAELPGQASAPLPSKRMAAKSAISKVARAQYYDQEAAATDA